LEWKRKNPDHKAKVAKQCDETVSEYDSDQYACFRVSETDSENMWYVDSGASTHMCSNRNFFVKLDEQQKGQVILANGEKLTT